MLRASWLFLGVAVLVGACANGTEDTDNSAGEGGAPGADATAIGPDATSGADDGSSRSDDAGGNPGDDSGQIAGDDSGSEDSGGDDGSNGEDGGKIESDAGDDSSVADAGHDSGTLDAGHDSGIEIDAGHDSGTTGADAGHDSGTAEVDSGQDSGTAAGEDAGCSAPVPPSFTKTLHPPSSTGTCNATQVGAFYTDCLAGSAATCSPWQTANSSCNTCLAGSSSPTDTDWGPYVAYTASQIDEIDLGACLDFDPSAAGGKSNIVTCSDDLEYLMECEHAACDASCAGASLGGYNACQTAADGSASLCQSEYNAVYGAGVACSKVSSACFGGTDFQSSFTAVAQVMCE